MRNARPDGLNCNIHVTIITKSLFTVRRFNKKDFKLIVRFFRVLNRASGKQIFSHIVSQFNCGSQAQVRFYYASQLCPWRLLKYRPSMISLLRFILSWASFQVWSRFGPWAILCVQGLAPILHLSLNISSLGIFARLRFCFHWGFYFKGCLVTLSRCFLKV